MLVRLCFFCSIFLCVLILFHLYNNTSLQFNFIRPYPLVTITEAMFPSNHTQSFSQLFPQSHSFRILPSSVYIYSCIQYIKNNCIAISDSRNVDQTERNDPLKPSFVTKKFKSTKGFFICLSEHLCISHIKNRSENISNASIFFINLRSLQSLFIFIIQNNAFFILDIFTICNGKFILTLHM